ncbi:hypothetical protein NL676_024028 [Syzygium grande]|nr:hypothetical protein NL676_024028 [Syzygium grande]
MTTGAGIVSLTNGKLMVSGQCVLSDVHDNVSSTPVASNDDVLCDGAFTGDKSDHKGSLGVLPVGKLLQGFTFHESLSLQDVVDDAVDGQLWLRHSLRDPISGISELFFKGNEQNEMIICLESGDPSIDTFNGSHLVFAVSGSNPFDVVTYAVKAIEKYEKTFCHLERKKIPDTINWFGWCTWDAFYTDVTEEGLKLGLESFKKGGIAPKFLIIDDGWQSVVMDPTGIESKAEDTAQREAFCKHKFRKHPKEGHAEKELGCGLQRIVAEIKEQHANLVYRMSYPGGQANGVCNVLKSIMTNGVGLVKPEKAYDFYNDLHSYLASTGVDGVKVDAQTILETLGKGHGRRVNLARKYHEALEASIASNFSDNDIISCMSNNTDSLYSGKKTAIMRASDDFFPRDPASHTIHVASSQHPMAEYHGAARAVGGCAIYVSDKPECHDFNLLKKVSLPDSSILRASYRGGQQGIACFLTLLEIKKKNLLKMWNLNSFSGVIGVFNCQGAGWCQKTITGSITAKDVDYLPRVADDGWSGDTIVYTHRGGEVVHLPKNSSYSMALNPRGYDVFTVVPVKSLSNGAKFAPIGLLETFNSRGAISDMKQGSGLVTFALEVPDEDLYLRSIIIKF